MKIVVPSAVTAKNVQPPSTLHTTGMEGSTSTLSNLELARRLAEMEALIQRIPGMPALIKKISINSFADSPFVDVIVLVEMPRKLSFPNMKHYNGTIDPDDHIAQYR
ncbi:hypothetical protein ACOSQ2_017334 [Xanthoceras sorbifolium]